MFQAQAPTDVPPTDKVTRLGQQLERGEATLEYRDGAGYLPSLLEQLDINIDSQTLVFSNTSFQQSIINPRNPHALYFNDEVSIGMVPGGDVYELLALEPSHGMVFYSLSTKETERPRLQRRGIEGLFCHAMGNKGARSLVVASVFPDPDGVPAYTSTFISTIDRRTPFEQRWGGWFVTGTHGSQKHRGNAVASDPLRPLDLELSGTLVYSDIFDRLPPPVSERVYRRLYEALTVNEIGARFGLSAADRRALLEILIDSKPSLPDYWGMRRS